MDTTIIGRRAVCDYLERNPEKVEKIWILRSGNFSNTVRAAIKTAKKNGAVLQYVDRATLDRLSNGQVHQGIIARISVCKTWRFDDWLEQLDVSRRYSTALILDGVMDPRNLGAIFRSAASVEVDGIIIPKRGSAPFSPAAMKSSAGTLDCLPAIRVTNISQTILRLQKAGYWIVGISEKSEHLLYETEIPEKVALLLGSEGTGIRPGNEKLCDHRVKIPMTGPAGSLNIAAAVSIVLYEVLIQRRTGPRFKGKKYS